MFCIKQYLYIGVLAITLSLISSMFIKYNVSLENILTRIQNKEIKLALLVGILGLIIHIIVNNTMLHLNCNNSSQK